MKISTSNEISLFQTVEVSTVEELGKLATGSNISTSVFKDGKRNIANFQFADCIGLDIDNDKEGTEKLSLAEAVRIFSPFKHLILSTKNHNVEKNGVVAERFRIILFPEWQVTNAKDFYSTWYYLKDQFPWIDNQCKDPSRFWYQHKEVLSVKEKGTLIPVIKHSEPEKPMKENRPVKPGERGKLSSFALNVLAFGVEAGSRNGTVYKVAKEFQQALYDYDEAETRILGALELNGVICSDFPESEAKLAISSAYTKDATHAPRLADVKPRAFTYQTLETLLATEERPEDWLVDGLFLKGGMSVVVGQPKIGKTTLIRQLERCVLRGEPFLGRTTRPGKIAHYSFDEKARTAKRHYSTLGLTKDDPMILHFGSAGENYIKEFEEDLMEQRPALVVVDTLFDLVDAQDVNNYGPIKRQLSYFNSVAEKSGAHLLFIHHQNKPNQFYSKGSGHSVLGSTAIFGSVDCLIVFEQAQNPDMRAMAVQGRGIDNFDDVLLSFDKEKMIFEIAPNKQAYKKDDFF